MTVLEGRERHQTVGITDQEGRVQPERNTNIQQSVSKYKGFGSCLRASALCSHSAICSSFSCGMPLKYCCASPRFRISSTEAAEKSANSEGTRARKTVYLAATTDKRSTGI
jgi:hypothetical protein